MLLILGFAESSDAAEPMFAYEDREVPGRKRAAVAPKGARLKSADVGVGRLMAGPGRWSEQHRGGRGGGPQGRGPSAARGSVAPEERTPGSFTAAGRLAPPRLSVLFRTAGAGEAVRRSSHRSWAGALCGCRSRCLPRWRSPRPPDPKSPRQSLWRRTDRWARDPRRTRLEPPVGCRE